MIVFGLACVPTQAIGESATGTITTLFFYRICIFTCLLFSCLLCFGNNITKQYFHISVVINANRYFMVNIYKAAATPNASKTD